MKYLDISVQIDQMNRLQKDLTESGLLSQSSMSAEIKLAQIEGNEILQILIKKNSISVVFIWSQSCREVQAKPL